MRTYQGHKETSGGGKAEMGSFGYSNGEAGEAQWQWHIQGVGVGMGWT